MAVKRDLYLAAYDVSEPGRLRRALEVVKEYACGGQKSVYECYLTAVERRSLLDDLRKVLHEVEDRFFLIRLDPRAKVSTLGIAVRPADPEYFYVG
jgi:CRISPR-associated protein Cas2